MPPVPAPAPKVRTPPPATHGAVVPLPVTRTAVAVADAPARPPADLGSDQALARLARGVQDCARALASLADRIDGLERRLDAVTTSPPPPPPPPALPIVPATSVRLRPPTYDVDSLETRFRALEGLSADRLQGLDQRLRRLETLPQAVLRLQHDAAALADAGRTHRTTADAGRVDLDPIYQELDSVSALVSSQEVAAAQSLERVRTLERAVLEMRRHLERNLAEHNRVATSEHAAARARLDAVEARLTTTP